MSEIIVTDSPKLKTKTEIDALIKNWKIRDDFGEYLYKQSERINKLMNAGQSPFKVLKIFNGILDKALKEGFPPPSCKKGCSHCCYVGVAITGLEAEYIQFKTGKKIKNKSNSTPPIDESRPCTFLKNGECSIYEFRPIACRVFMSFDHPSFCEDATNTHAMLSFIPDSSRGFYWANLVGANIVKFYFKRDAERFKYIADIRHFFEGQ